MSTRAIVMSEEVYFNEPGFEGEAGTSDGERKDEGYSNIVNTETLNMRWSNKLGILLVVLKLTSKLILS